MRLAIKTFQWGSYIPNPASSFALLKIIAGSLAGRLNSTLEMEDLIGNYCCLLSAYVLVDVPNTLNMFMNCYIYSVKTRLVSHSVYREMEIKVQILAKKLSNIPSIFLHGE